MAGYLHFDRWYYDDLSTCYTRTLEICNIKCNLLYDTVLIIHSIIALENVFFYKSKVRRLDYLNIL